MLDVGMDQSILLAEEGQGLLVDTGLAEYGPNVFSRIKDHGVETLDYLILSYLHPDHAGVYFQIRAAWPDTPVFTTCTIPQQLHPTEQEALLRFIQPLKVIPYTVVLRPVSVAPSEITDKGYSQM